MLVTVVNFVPGALDRSNAGGATCHAGGACLVFLFQGQNTLRCATLRPVSESLTQSKLMLRGLRGCAGGGACCRGCCADGWTCRLLLPETSQLDPVTFDRSILSVVAALTSTSFARDLLCSPKHVAWRQQTHVFPTKLHFCIFVSMKMSPAFCACSLAEPGCCKTCYSHVRYRAPQDDPKLNL